MITRETVWRQSLALTRTLHTTRIVSSHIGKTPIPLPPSVTIDYPLLSIAPTTSITSDLGRRIISITGPLGSQSLLVLPPVILHPPATDSGSPSVLSVKVHDENIKRQKSVWGFTRSIINNAVVGVTEGYKLNIRLVGVGYRATIEPIPAVFIEQMKIRPPKQKARKPGAHPPTIRDLPTQRLNLKLGFSHPVLIDIPSDIQVTMTSPTTISLFGLNKEELGLFAASIRHKRKPEPYRGKVSVFRMLHVFELSLMRKLLPQGVFVGDETIKLKEVKKK